MFQSDFFVGHDLGEVLEQVAGCYHESLVKFIALHVKGLLVQVEPILDKVEVEECLLCSLDDPFLLHRQISGSCPQSLGLISLLCASSAELFDLRYSSPTDSKTIIVSVDNVLLLEHEDAVDGQGLALQVGTIKEVIFWSGRLL